MYRESCLPNAVELLVRPTSFPPFAWLLFLLMFTSLLWHAMTYNPLFRPLENHARANNETNTGEQATSHISSYPRGVPRDGARSGRPS